MMSDRDQMVSQVIVIWHVMEPWQRNILVVDDDDDEIFVLP